MAAELDTEAQLHPASAFKSPIKYAKTLCTGLNKDISSEEKATLRISRGKRDLNSLEATRHESRYLSETQKGYWVGRQRQHSEETATSSKKRAKIAASCSWAGYLEWKEQEKLDRHDDIPVAGEFQESTALDEGMARIRRFAIQYIFVEHFGTPKKEHWGDFSSSANVPTLISRQLKIPNGSYAKVVKVLEDIIDAHDAGKCYDPSKNIREQRGGHSKIVDLTPQAEVVYRLQEAGMSTGRTVVILNRWRKARQLEPICYDAVRRFMNNSQVLVVESRGTRKAGKTEDGAPWAKARKAFDEQLLRQINKGRRINSGGADYIEAEDGPPDQAALEVPVLLEGGYVVMDQVLSECSIKSHNFSRSLSFSLPPPTSTITNVERATRALLKVVAVEMLMATTLPRSKVACFPGGSL